MSSDLKSADPASTSPCTRSQLRHLAHVIVPLLQPQPRETQRQLTAPPVFLQQVHGELVQHLLRGSLHGPAQAPVVVHHDEPKGLVDNEELVQVLRVELVVAQVQRCVDALKRLEVDVHAPLLVVVSHHRAAVDHQVVFGAANVQLQSLLRRRDGATADSLRPKRPRRQSRYACASIHFRPREGGGIVASSTDNESLSESLARDESPPHPTTSRSRYKLLMPKSEKSTRLSRVMKIMKQALK